MDRLTDGLDDCMDQSVERQIDIYGDLDGKKSWVLIISSSLRRLEIKFQVFSRAQAKKTWI